MMHAKKACRKMVRCSAWDCCTSVYSCFAYLHLYFIKTQQFVYRNVTVQKANNILYTWKKKGKEKKKQSDMLVTHSSRKPHGLVSGLGNLKPVSQ